MSQLLCCDIIFICNDINRKSKNHRILVVTLSGLNLNQDGLDLVLYSFFGLDLRFPIEYGNS